MFGDNLIEVRKKKQMSQQQLADQLKVSLQTIVHWETNQTVPDANQILLICEALQMSVDCLLRGEEAKPAAVQRGGSVCFVVTSIFLMLVWVSAFVLFIACIYADFFSNMLQIFSMILVFLSPILYAINLFYEKRRIRRLK